jgi:HEAT repeat protein
MNRSRLVWIAIVVIWAVAASAFVARQQEQALARFTSESPAVRAAAIRDSSQDGDERLLIARLDDDDADVRLIATQRLAYAKRNRGAVAVALAGQLSDKHAGVRREAAWSLGVLGVESWPPLREALKDDDAAVRAGAALAIADAYKYSNDDDAWPSQVVESIVPVLESLREDEDATVRANVDDALRFLR